MNKALVVVSHYAPYPPDALARLTEKLKSLTKDVLVVINDDNVDSLSLDSGDEGVRTLIRPNTGMNIGGWDAAYKTFPEFDFYIFMQDECEVLREDFIAAYVAELSKDDVGMTGESINPKWDTGWNEIARSSLNYEISLDSKGSSVPRLNYYLYCMDHWGIDPGQNGRHLRSLVWAFNQRALSSIKGFPIGLHKEECIAAEIAVSKSIEQHGLKVTQVSRNPFEYIHHVEWQRDGHRKVQLL